MTPLIAITGGIGSGKSAVCRCLSTWGLPIYDCDSQAKRLMDDSPEIHRLLREKISPGTVVNGVIDRRRLADIVFSDPDSLKRLNTIVHGVVIEDIRHWRDKNESGHHPLLFIETAILLESNLHKEVDEVWLVEAPVGTRLRRACQRDSSTEKAILSRMRRQRPVTAGDLSVPMRVIDNDGYHPIIPQLLQLLGNHGIATHSLSGQWKN